MWSFRIRPCSATSFRCFRLHYCSQDSTISRASSHTLWFLKTVQLPHHGKWCGLYLSQRCAHTGKGWKLIANPKLAEAVEDDPPFIACEEGSNAIPHKELLATLNLCKSLREQVYTLSSMLSLTPEDIENRKQFCESMCQTFKLYLPESRVSQFGSGMNLLGFKGSDIDVCIRTTLTGEKPAEYTKTLSPPTPDEVLNGLVDTSFVSNLHPKHLLRFVRRVIRKHCKEVREPIIFVKARCPILRFYHEKYDLFCDFSCENTPAMRNTKLLRFIVHMDSRVGPLIQVLRYWGKMGKFVGDLDMFNSYAFSLLVVYYLQNTMPPVIPPLKELLAKAEYLNFGEVDDDDLLISSLKHVPVSENKQSIEELLKGFFLFYSFFDFRRVMLLLNGSSVPVMEFQSGEENPTDVFEMASVCLQDPYRLSLNATAGLEYRTGIRFLSSVVEACVMFQNDKTLIPSLKSENWGLSQLFESSVYYPQEVRNNAEVSTDAFVADIPPASIDTVDKFLQASQMVKTIFEHCFLFKCKPMDIKPHHYDGTLPILKFSCEVNHNIWVGRNRVIKEKFSALSSMKCLELERSVSLELLDYQKTGKLPVLFKLICECYSGESIDSPQLKVKLMFEPGKLPTILSIFLKEHVPRILKSASQKSDL